MYDAHIPTLNGSSTRAPRPKSRFRWAHRVSSLSIFIGLAMTLLITVSFASYQRNPLPKAGTKSLSETRGRSFVPNAKVRTNRIPTANPALLTALMSPPTPTQEEITLYAQDCSTPKTAFSLGETVCAKVEGGPDLNIVKRRLAVIDSGPFVVSVTPITTDPQTVSYTLPTGPTSTVDGITYDNRGVWRINSVPSSRFSVRASVTFTVSDPAAPAADISVSKGSDSSGSITAGSNISYAVLLKNSGPDAASNIQLNDAIPGNMTFLSGVQEDGPSFTCSYPTANSSTGTISCTIATLASGASVRFLFVFNVDTGTAAGTTLTNSATGASDTTDAHPEDNTATSAVTVVAGAAGSTCTLDCPDNVNAIANTTEASQRGAHVTFADAVGTGDCGSVTATPASGSFFPVGDTTVTVTSETGDGSCSFTVTVIDNGTNPPSISCPSNKTANSDANCAASVVLGTPTTAGDNVTVVASRSDGKPMYDCDVNGENCVRKSTDLPFSTGVTTVTWIAYSHDTPGPYANNDDEAAHRLGAALCNQTVTVNDVTPPSITSPSPTASANANCQAAVPNFSTIASVSDNCACASSDTSQICDSRQDIVITQDVAPGTMVGLGPHTINLTANDGSSNNGGLGNSTTIQVTFTVVDTTAPAFTFVPPTVVAYTGPGATSCDTVVSDATLGTATATDNCSAVTITRTPSGNTFPVGNTTVVWKATDAAGNFSTANQTVTVIDNTPPTITLNGNQPSMWPPNHKYQTFTVTNFVTSVFDNCGGVNVSNVKIDHVTSDETENGNGDGNTLNDIVIASDCRSVQLRSERDGGGDGRVYTITFSLTDTHGNTTTATANVVVPHNPGETPVNSGAHYTVNGGCP